MPSSASDLTAALPKKTTAGEGLPGPAAFLQAERTQHGVLGSHLSLGALLVSKQQAEDRHKKTPLVKINSKAQFKHSKVKERFLGCDRMGVSPGL